MTMLTFRRYKMIEAKKKAKEYLALEEFANKTGFGVKFDLEIEPEVVQITEEEKEESKKEEKKEVEKLVKEETPEPKKTRKPRKPKKA